MVPLLVVSETPVPPVELSEPEPVVVIDFADPPLVLIEIPPFAATAPVTETLLSLVSENVPLPLVIAPTVIAEPVFASVMFEVFEPPPFVAVKPSVWEAILMVPFAVVRDIPVPPAELREPAPLVVIDLALPALVSIEMPPSAVAAPVTDTLLLLVSKNVPLPSVTAPTLIACPD